MIRRLLTALVFLSLAAPSFALGQDKVAAHDFTLVDLAGKTWRLSDQKGKVVLLDFTTTWCPWCVKDIPHLKKLSQKYQGNRSFEFVAVYLQESRQKVSSFALKKGLPYRILLDLDGKVAAKYGVRGVPTKVVVDKDGNVLCWMCRDEEAIIDKALRK